jgi:hypothetical protein
MRLTLVLALALVGMAGARPVRYVADGTLEVHSLFFTLQVYLELKDSRLGLTSIPSI